MTMRDKETVLPFVFVSVILLLCMWLGGCAVSMQLMTDSQHRARTQDRVLIDRAHGSYQGDNATTLDEYRERYRVANDQQSDSGM